MRYKGHKFEQIFSGSIYKKRGPLAKVGKHLSSGFSTYKWILFPSPSKITTSKNIYSIEEREIESHGDVVARSNDSRRSSLQYQKSPKAQNIHDVWGSLNGRGDPTEGSYISMTYQNTVDKVRNAPLWQSCRIKRVMVGYRGCLMLLVWGLAQ